MSKQHTPGPWRTSGAALDGFAPIMAPGGVIVAMVSTLSHTAKPDANLRRRTRSLARTPRCPADNCLAVDWSRHRRRILRPLPEHLARRRGNAPPGLPDQHGRRGDRQGRRPMIRFLALYTLALLAGAALGAACAYAGL